MKSLPRRTWPRLLILLALFVTACGEAPVDQPTGDRAERSTPVTAAEVLPRDLSRRLNLSAHVEPRHHIRLASRSAGILEEVLVEEGDRVQRGQLLVRLDTAETEAELARARAAAQRAEADYNRMRELHRRSVVAPAEYENARAALEVARAEQVLWQTRLGFGHITAPRDGMVAARHVEPGEAVQAQGPVLDLVALDDLILRLGVSELDVVGLAPGQPVALRVDALPGVGLQGSVRRIFPLADGASRLITVEVGLPESARERGVRPGFLARAQFTVDSRSEALAVPSAALGVREQQRYVYVIDGGRLHARPVEVGISRGDWTEVLDGLQRGELVLASSPIDMSDGQRVRIVGWRG